MSKQRRQGWWMSRFLVPLLLLGASAFAEEAPKVSGSPIAAALDVVDIGHGPQRSNPARVEGKPAVDARPVAKDELANQSDRAELRRELRELRKERRERFDAAPTRAERVRERDPRPRREEQREERREERRERRRAR